MKSSSYKTFLQKKEGGPAFFFSNAILLLAGRASGTMLAEDFIECRGTAGMAAAYGNVKTFGLANGADHHFMGDSVGEQYQKIWNPHFSFQGSIFLDKYFRLAAVLFTDRLIFADHAFVASDDNDAHTTPHFLIIL